MNKEILSVGTRIEMTTPYLNAEEGATGTIKEWRGLELSPGIEFDNPGRGSHTLDGKIANSNGLWVNQAYFKVSSSISSNLQKEAEELTKTELPAFVEFDLDKAEADFGKANVVKKQLDDEQAKKLAECRKEADALYEKSTSSNHPKDDKLTIKTETVYKKGDKVAFVRDDLELEGIIDDIDAEDETFNILFEDEDYHQEKWIEFSSVCRKVASAKEHPGEKYLPKKMKKTVTLNYLKEKPFKFKSRENARVKSHSISLH